MLGVFLELSLLGPSDYLPGHFHFLGSHVKFFFRIIPGFNISSFSFCSLITLFLTFTISSTLLTLTGSDSATHGTMPEIPKDGSHYQAAWPVLGNSAFSCTLRHAKGYNLVKTLNLMPSTHSFLALVSQNFQLRQASLRAVNPNIAYREI